MTKKILFLLMINSLTNRRRMQQRNGKKACYVTAVNDGDPEILCSLDEKGGKDSKVWKTDSGCCFGDDETFLLLNKKLSLKKRKMMRMRRLSYFLMKNRYYFLMRTKNKTAPQRKKLD